MFVATLALLYFCQVIELPRFIMPLINIFFKMKFFKTYFGILFLSLTVLSCTNDINVSEAQLIKQIVETATDGSSIATTINYNSNKITSIDNTVKSSTFSYTGLLVTKIVELDKVTNHTTTLVLTYVDNDLVKITSSDNYVVNYVHNTDGTVSYEKWVKDASNIDVKVNHGVLYYAAANLIKEVTILDNTAANSVSTKTTTYGYDAKNNGLRNAAGFSALLNYGNLVSKNNTISKTEITEVKNTETDQITSSLNQSQNEFKYDAAGYPMEIVGEETFFGEAQSNHAKTLFYY